MQERFLRVYEIEPKQMMIKHLFKRLIELLYENIVCIDITYIKQTLTQGLSSSYFEFYIFNVYERE